MIELNDFEIHSKINDFILSTGSVHDRKGFAVELVKRASDIVPFDHARIYYIDGNEKIEDQYIVGIDKKWVSAYHEYYSKVGGGKYKFNLEREDRLMRGGRAVGVRDWTVAEVDEFVNDYVRQIGIKHSCGFNLFDVRGQVRTVFMLDRTTNRPFTGEEKTMLLYAFPHLNNLHKNFFNQVDSAQVEWHKVWKQGGLTNREIEIADLLCAGIKPANISTTLHIAQPTTYKHIAHIYEKMRVSSIQELLVKLLNR